MGSSSDIMHEFVSQEIRRLYSSYNGWNVAYRNPLTAYDEIICLQRFTGGSREFAMVGVTFSREVDPKLIDTITSPERSGDGTVARLSSALVIPENANVAGVPTNVAVHHMHSFAFDGESLVWVKKPVISETAPAPVK